MIESDEFHGFVQNILDSTFQSLAALGMEQEDAAALLVVQAAVRMRSSEKLSQLRDFIARLSDVEPPTPMPAIESST